MISVRMLPARAGQAMGGVLAGRRDRSRRGEQPRVATHTAQRSAGTAGPTASAPAPSAARTGGHLREGRIANPSPSNKNETAGERKQQWTD